MSQEFMFKEIFVREMNKCREHLGQLGAETVSIKYTFQDKEDKDLMNEVTFKIRPKRDEE